MTVEFHPLAMRDLLDAQIYYKSISRNLGHDFRQKVDDAVSIIQAARLTFIHSIPGLASAAPISNVSLIILSLKSSSLLTLFAWSSCVMIIVTQPLD